MAMKHLSGNRKYCGRCCLVEPQEWKENGYRKPNPLAQTTEESRRRRVKGTDVQHRDDRASQLANDTCLRVAVRPPWPRAHGPDTASRDEVESL